jgi:hypothetical protein
MTTNELYINDNWKRVGVRVSGGADSSILYYAICDHFKDRPDVEIYPLTMNTPFKWWYSRGAKVVIDRVTELTGKAPADWFIHHYPHFTKDAELQKYEDGINEMQRLAVAKYDLDVVYIGLTKNPPISEMKTYFTTVDHGLDVERVIEYIDSRDETRDDQTDPEFMTVHYDMGENNPELKVQQVIPFANAHKKAVKSLYDKYNAIDILYPYTYSCEEVPEVTTEPLVHCKHCFFCLERWWGFGRIL